ncbi:MAG: hypothetical protein H0U13_13160 [Gemmatimonadaceae bacterium]|nr:hypothetical protein [Gemmatimonadaceae bacterium]
MISSFLFQSAAPLPLDEIRAHLEALPTVRRDRWDDAVYIVADDAATLQLVTDARENSGDEAYPRVAALVRLYDARIDFSLQTREVETVRVFARWLRAGHDVAILDEAFKDISSECDDNLDYLFGTPRKRRLVAVGFFRELKHGRADGPSLREAMRDKGKPGESRIAAYLREAPILLHAVGPVTDVFEPKGDYICAPNIHTDGVYAWPEDLAHYVERYHVALPAEFLAHVASAKWKAPTDVDTATVELG